MKRSKIYLYIIACYAVLLAAIQFLGYAEGNVSTAMAIVTPLLGIALGIDALMFFGLKTTQSKGVLSIIVALSLWLIADVLWILNESEELSMADGFYFAGYIALFLAAVFGIMTVKEGFFKDKRHLTGFIFALLAVFVIYYFFPLGWDTESSFLENMVVGGYVLVDMLILVPVLFIIVAAFTGAFSKPWIMIGVGMVLNFVSDLLYTMSEESIGVFGSNIMELGWYLAYLAFAIGFVLLKSKTEEILAA